jgi:hypothetical protein
MKTMSICLMTGFALATALPVSAMAQSSDAAYCQKLTNTYEAYVANVGGRRDKIDQNADAQIAVNKCQAGDMSGIPVLEQTLRDAKFNLPSRG